MHGEIRLFTVYGINAALLQGMDAVLSVLLANSLEDMLIEGDKYYQQ
jgi:hypothetical protein